MAVATQSTHWGSRAALVASVSLSFVTGACDEPPPPVGRFSAHAAEAASGLAPTEAESVFASEPPVRTRIPTCPDRRRTEAKSESTCPADMAYIPGGKLTRGSHSIGSTMRPYCLDTHPVTLAGYADCVRKGECGIDRVDDQSGVPFADACTWNDPSKCNHPINCVTHAQAHKYCMHRGRRLPTEAEWRWAWHGGTANAPFPTGFHPPQFGESCLQERHKPVSITCDVDAHPKSITRHGVADLIGNVAEWVATPERPSAIVYLDGGTGFHGGLSATNGPASRSGSSFTHGRAAIIGFRCAKDIALP